MLNNENNYIWLNDDCFKSIEIYLNNELHDYVNGSLKLSEGLNSSEYLDLSNTESSSFEFSIIDYHGSIKSLNNQKVDVYLNGKYQGISNRIKIGTFIVDKAERVDERIVKVTCYDNMLLLDTDVALWWNGLSFPITIREILISLCNYAGVNYDLPDTFTNSDYLINTKPMKANTLNGRDMLGYLNEVCGMYFRFNRNGFLVPYPLGNKAIYPSDALLPQDTLYPKTNYDLETDLSLVSSLNVSEDDNPAIDKLVVRESSEVTGIIIGNGSNAYIIENNPLLYSDNDSSIRPYLENIYNVLSNINYTKADVDLKYLPYLEVGDRIGIKTSKGEEIALFILKRDVNNFPYGLETISSAASTKISEYSSVNKSIDKLKGITHTLNNTIDELSSTIFDEDTGLQTQILQNTENIKLKVGTDNVVNAINLSSEGITINGNKINIEGNTTFASLTTTQGGETVIDGGMIKSNSIEADKIKTNELVVLGGDESTTINSGNITTSGKIYASGLSSTGAISATGVAHLISGLDIGGSAASKYWIYTSGAELPDTDIDGTLNAGGLSVNNNAGLTGSYTLNDTSGNPVIFTFSGGILTSVSRP